MDYVVYLVDRLKSKTNKTKIVSEYLIYVMLNHDGEDIRLKAFSEIGQENKIHRMASYTGCPLPAFFGTLCSFFMSQYRFLILCVFLFSSSPE